MAGVPQITGDLPQRRKSAAMGQKLTRQTWPAGRLHLSEKDR